MNSSLKEISAICTIDKRLTTHLVRHTVACLAVEYGMPRHAGKDSPTYGHQHDAALRQVLREVDRQGDDKVE